MIMPVHTSPAVSLKAITLWVEDDVTREYLDSVWQDVVADFDIRVGGDHPTIAGLVHEQRVSGVGKVFGFCDRDFVPSNQAKWADQKCDIEVFRPEVQEIENYLLDWDALAGSSINRCLHRRSTTDIENFAAQRAQELVWWMACFDVSQGYYRRLTKGFPKEPSQDVSTRADAIGHIQSSAWFVRSGAQAAGITAAALANDIDAEHGRYTGYLATGSWTTEFCGKQVFRHLRGWLYDVPTGTPASRDKDLAKSVGEWQYANGAVPPALIALRDALKQRVGLL